MEDGNGEWQDWLEDETQNQEASFADSEEYFLKKNILTEALEFLNERESQLPSDH